VKRLLLLLLFPLLVSAAKWTVLVYMAADNDLAEFADSDLVEMERIGSSNDLTIVVQVDKPNIGCRRLGVVQDTFVTFGDLGTIDMCNWQTLYDFLDWGFRGFPADRYLVVLWDHGTGWTAQPRRSFGSDQSSGNQLGITNGDFQKAIRYLYNSLGRKVDLFTFDACGMQEIEIGCEIKDYAKVMMAVQGAWPLKGFPYDKILQVIRDDPGINEINLASRMTRLCRDEYVGIQANAVSAVRLDLFANLVRDWSNFAAETMRGKPDPALRGVRDGVQTIPLTGVNPRPTDDFVDFGDLLNRLAGLYPGKRMENLLADYRNAVVESAYSGDSFARATGLTVWFPYGYPHFKELVGSYVNLDWTASSWPQFLNWFYNADDIRPKTVQLTVNPVGADNNFRLAWTKSFDLALTSYGVIEVKDTSVVLFHDAAEDSSLWNFNGFALSQAQLHSGNYSFFSGNAINLNNSIETINPVTIAGLGLLDLYLFYNTQEFTDSLVVEYGPFRDVHYGYSGGWINRRAILPAGSYTLKITYRTDAATNLGGCYIDDIYVYELTAGRYIRQGLADTTLDVFNKSRGDFNYAVQPVDRYANFGDVSEFVPVSLTSYAQPYSLPNPFQNECDLVLDYPDSINPVVHIFSIAGRKVQSFPPKSIRDKKVHWDGRDDRGRIVGAGIYFILVEGGSFKRLGKIARQR
jgi:hypothetical protein